MTIFSIFYLLVSTILPSPNQGSIDITIRKIQEPSGSVKIALYKNPKDFPDRDKAFKVVEKKAQVPNVHHTFENLPQGDYAIAVFHDKNDDGELNFKLFFIPNEPYGFSNNFVPRYSKPTFNDARFTVRGTTQMTISLVE